jgi:SpoVK/Ycf46/Vps4 family AAA+-type ATPase
MKEMMRRPHVRSDKRQGRICWCGNPSCPGGLAAPGGTPGGSSFSADEVEETTIRPQDVRIERIYPTPSLPVISVADLRRIQDQLMKDVLFSSRITPEQRSNVESGPPSSYTAARGRVARWLHSAESGGWDEVVGVEDAVQAMEEAVEARVSEKELYEFYGMKPPRGVLLSGPPGCGKTMLARVAAKTLARIYGTEAEYLLIGGTELQSKYVGVTEERIRNIFAFSREYEKFRGHPLVIFFDEADAMFPDRNSRVRGVMSWEESQVATMLAEMDGVRESGAFIIMATNRPQALDEALLRDGRLDRKIKVNRPSQESVAEIVRRALKNVPLGDDLEMLVMTATESLFDPHRVVKETTFIRAHLEASGVVVDESRYAPLRLEHIVSGAMAVGLAERCKTHAFRRDRASKTRTGVTSKDVISAVNEVHQENVGFDHSYAVEEFKETLSAESQKTNRH